MIFKRSLFLSLVFSTHRSLLHYLESAYIIFTMFIKIPKLLVIILISASSARHLNLQQENSTDEGFEELVEEVMNVILTDDENFNTTSSKILGTIGEENYTVIRE